MPAFTYLSDHEVREGRTVLDDKECDNLLQEIRTLSGTDWIVGVRRIVRPRTMADRLRGRPAAVVRDYTLYADCCGEWQVINLATPRGGLRIPSQRPEPRRRDELHVRHGRRLHDEGARGMSEPYDSRAETLAHIHRVRDFLGTLAAEMLERGRVHDQSKLGPDEKPFFDRETPKLKELTFGSDEYKASLARLGEGLKHHYAVNSHHPEHYADGVAGMDLLDLVEMFCDWRAAAERNANKTVNLSMCVDRFKIEPQLAAILKNTLDRL